MDRAGDRSGVATALGAESVKESASLDAVIEVGAWDVPQVGMPGDDAQCRCRASAATSGAVAPLGAHVSVHTQGRRQVASKFVVLAIAWREKHS